MAEVRYFLSAEVDGVMVFSSDYPDTTMLQEELYKAEGQVERELEQIAFDKLEEAVDES